MVNAFSMCNGQDNALPNTHGTITATLIVQTSMPSIVLIAPNPTTSSNSTSSGFGGAGITSPSTSVPSTLSLQTATGSPTKTAATSTRSTQVASETASITPALTKPQIVGISVASVGGGALAVGSLILFACWRRRKRAARDSDMLPFQLDPSNGTKYSYGFRGPTERKHLGPGGTPHGVAAKVPPRVPPRLETSTPNMFSRRSIRPDTIGLAISPETNMAERRHSSKLLPEKPTLTLKVPQYQENRTVGGPSGSQPAQQSAQQQSAISRQSTATQFEEDEEGVDTAVAGEVADETWGRKSTAQILDNATGNWQTIKPEIPKPPPSTFVVNGGDSNQWRPGQAPKANTSSVVPDYYVKPLNLSRGVGSFSQPRRPEEYPRPAQQQLQQLQIPKQAARPITTSSSVYSTRGSSLPPSEIGRNSNAPRSRRSYKQTGPYDSRESTGSLTSFETDSIISPQEPEPRTAGTDLSPVVESPSGTSPVSYPKIPKRLSLATIRMVPPPPQPDFGIPMNLPPWRQAELAAQRERMGLAPLQANPAAQGQKPIQAQLGAAFAHQRQRSRDYIAPSAAYNSLPSKAPSLQPQTKIQGQNNLAGEYQTQLRSGPRPRGNLNPLDTNPTPNITFSRTSSNISQTSKASTSSSLLAKRRGEQKALALIGSLNSGKNSEEERKKRQERSGWRVLKEGDKERAKSPGWRPMLGAGGAEGGGGGGSAGLTVGNANVNAGNGNGNAGVNADGKGGTQFEQTELPRTPGWVPRLTPTRRGDELFLSVQ